MFMGVAPYCVLSVNLMFGRIVKERHEKSEQPTAQLVGTSWDYGENPSQELLIFRIDHGKFLRGPRSS